VVNIIRHNVDVGDPQKDMELARCSCGWMERVPESDQLTSLEAHYELMTLAWGHVYANAWMMGDDESVAAVRWANRADDSGNAEQFVSDGLGGGA